MSELNDYKLNSKQVADITGYSKSYIQQSWRKMANNGFPKPKRIGVRVLKWSKSEVEKFAKGMEAV